jgi:hypothetical protein
MVKLLLRVESMKKFIKKNKYILLLLIIVVISLVPLTFGSIKYDGDFNYHLTRIESLYQGIIKGQIPLKIHDIFFNGYGYPVGVFYPNFLLTLPAVLRMLNIPLITSYNISIVVYSFITAFAMYYSFYFISKSKQQSFIAAAFYTLAAYRSTCLFYRGAYAEGLAFIFIPIIIAGIYDLIKNDKTKWYILTIGFTGLLLTHLITMIIMVIVSALVILINYKKTFKITKIKSFIISTITSIGLSAYFIIPFISYYFNQDWHFNYPWATINQFKSNFLNSLTYLQLQEPAGLFESPGFGISYIIILILVFIGYKKYKKDKFVLTLTFITLFLWLFTIDISLLDPIRDLLKFVQFPFRVNGLISACISMLAGIVITQLKNKKYLVIVLILLLTNSFYQIARIYPAVENTDKVIENLGYYPDNNYNEFLPSTTLVNDIYNRGQIIEVSNELNYDYTRDGSDFIINFRNNYEKGTTLELPLIHYPGYTALLTSDTYQGLIAVYPNVETSYVMINLDNHQQGSINFYYEPPRVEKIADLISIFTILMIVLFIIYTKKKQTD